MTNLLAILGVCIAIVEAIIVPTKEIATKKMSAELYTTIIQVIVGICGVIFDIYFNNPTISVVYVIEAIVMVAGLWLSTRMGYDNVVELIKAIQKANKNFKK